MGRAVVVGTGGWPWQVGLSGVGGMRGKGSG